MSGNTANASQWANADVYIAPANTAGPTDTSTVWAVAWLSAGLLDGDEGLSMSRDDDSNSAYAWGGILVKQTKSKHKRQVTFSMLEDNVVTFAFLNPGSTRATVSGTTTSAYKIPIYGNVALGFELRDGTKITRRFCKSAVIDKVDDVKDAESDLTVYKVTVTLYPESDGTIYREVSTVI